MAIETLETAAGVIPDDIVAGLTSEIWAHREEAVKKVGALLAEGGSRSVSDVAAEHLDRLAGDSKWEVRRAVAAALQRLVHPDFDRIIAKLIDDPNAYVRRTAAETLERRRRLAQLTDGAGDELETLLGEIHRLEARHSRETAESALRIGQTYFQVIAASTAHDLLNVLTALKQSLKSLEKHLSTSNSSAKKWPATMENAKRRCRIIESIARDLKTFSDRTPVAFHRENLVELVKEAINIVEDRFHDVPGAPSVVTEIAVDDRLTIDTPRLKLVQALTNIIKNSYESFSKKGVLAIAASADSEHLVLNINDNGCGMPEEVRRTAFMPGTSTKKGRPGRTENTGMGLAIAQKVIRECGGEIGIESAEGHGTKMTIRFPIATSDGDE